MPTVENVPGRRKAVPPRSEALRDLPARARRHLDGRRRAGDEQPPPPRTGPRSTTALRSLWVLALVTLTVGLAVLRVIEAPTIQQQSAAAAMGVVLAIGLAVRSGGFMPPAAALAAVVGVAAVASQWPPLLGGAAVATGVLAACLAVLGTRPAATFPAVLLEVVLALLLATVGALAVAGFSVEIDTERFAYAVLALAVVSTIAMVYRLGGGLHGLGGRGLILSAAAMALLVVVVVYTAALTRYGSPGLVEQVGSAQAWMRTHLGGVPHPVEVLVGIPAMVWGVSMRTRRRQGWWVCAFGSAATAEATTHLLDADWADPATAIAVGYSIVLGLLLGFVVIRFERVLTGAGRRTAREEPGHLQRQEPGRFHPLH